MSLFQTGMPAHWFTRRRAVAVGLLVVSAYLIVNEVGVRLTRWYGEPTTAPLCYDAGTRHVAGTQPIPPYGERDRNGRGIDDRVVGSEMDKLTPAQQACTPAACIGEAWKAYRSAIFWYVSPRLMHTDLPLSFSSRWS
jgi:hypothetical protein